MPSGTNPVLITIQSGPAVPIITYAMLNVRDPGSDRFAIQTKMI